MAEPEAADAAVNQVWGAIPNIEVARKFDEVSELAHLIVNGLMSGEYGSNLEVSQASELASSLAGAAVHLSRAQEIIGGLVVGEEAESPGAPALTDRTLNAAIAEQSKSVVMGAISTPSFDRSPSSPSPRSPSPVRIPIAVDRRTQVDTTPTAARRTIIPPLDPERSTTTNSVLIDIDPVNNENANESVRKRMGENARVVKVKSNGVFEIDGLEIPIATKNQHVSKEQRARIMTLLIKNRGHMIPARQISDVIGGAQASKAINLINEVLVDPAGNPIISIERPTPTRSNYAIAKDVIILDEQAGYTETSQALGDHAPLPTGGSQPTGKDHELAASRLKIIVKGNEIAVGARRTVVSELQASLFSTMLEVGRPLGEQEILQIINRHQDIDPREVREAGDAMFMLYKKGFLKLVRVGQDEAEYELSEDPVQTRQEQNEIEYLGQTVYLDAEDIKIIEVLSKAKVPISALTIAKEFFKLDRVSNAQIEFITRSVKTRFYGLKIAHNLRTEADYGARDGHIRFALNASFESVLPQILGTETQAPEDDSKSDGVDGGVPPLDGRAHTQLYPDSLVIEGQTSYKLAPLETRLIKRLDGSFGIPLLENDIITELYGDASITSRQAFSAAFTPLFKALGKSGYLLRDIRKGGNVMLSLLRPMSEHHD